MKEKMSPLTIITFSLNKKPKIVVYTKILLLNLSDFCFEKKNWIICEHTLPEHWGSDITPVFWRNMLQTQVSVSISPRLFFSVFPARLKSYFVLNVFRRQSQQRLRETEAGRKEGISERVAELNDKKRQHVERAQTWISKVRVWGSSVGWFRFRKRGFTDPKSVNSPWNHK